TGGDLVQKHYPAFGFLHQDVVVSQAGKFVGQLSQFMIVRGEKHAAADLIVQILGNGPSQTHAVVGAGAAADLIEDHQAAVGGVVEDVGGFGHLDHESAAAPGQLVAGADAREDAVNTADPRLAGR